MRFIKQLSIIFLFSLLGELARYYIPLGVPASIYGIVALLLALHWGIVKKEDIKPAGTLLVEIMPILFICPAVAGLLENEEALGAILLPVAVVTVVSTLLVMAIGGHVTQFLLKRRKRND